LLARRGYLGRYGVVVLGDVDVLERRKEDALALLVERAAGPGDVDRQVRHRGMRGDHRVGEDADEPEVGSEVMVSLLELSEPEVELGLRQALAKEVVESVGHGDLSAVPS